MKKKARVKQQRAARALLAQRYVIGFALALGAGFATAADEPDQTSFEGPEDAGKNWVEFGAGGYFTSGNQSQAEQNHRHADGVFGGISDLHFEKEIAKATTFSLDGRGIVDEHDYSFGLKLKKEEAYYLKLGFENFRTWSNGDGGYYPAAGQYYPLPGDALALDRGMFTLEGGLMLKNWPGLRFKYSHLYRDGEKGSTIWGQSHPGLINPSAGVVPTVQDIDESRHIFEVDLTHRIKAVDFGVGAVYEFGTLESQRRISQYPGEGAAAGERKITDRESTDYDLFNAHGFAETWLNKNLFFSAGYMFSDLQNDTTGSRVWGDDFSFIFVPDPGNGQGYTNLLGNARKQDHVANMNLMAKLGTHWTLTPSVRMQRQDWDANSAADSTSGVNTFGTTFSAADADAIDVRERLDLRYTGVTNFVFTARGEWTEGQGNLTENGGLFNGGTPGTPIQRETDETRWFQKYGLNAKWYASRRISVDVGGYYKVHSYDYDHTIDNTPNDSVANRYPAYLTLQDVTTQDGNVRVTWRPRSNLTLVGRYEYQLSTIDTGPDPISGLSQTESAQMTSHIVALNASWAPMARLYLQGGVSYVDSGLETPASDYTAAVLEAQNNYWSFNLNAGFVLDDKTDLNLGYTYYLADNYTDNTPIGVPYGSGAEEHGVSAMLVRRITKNIRASLRYSYYHYTDDSAGGWRDYDAHGVYTRLQYRF